MSAAGTSILPWRVCRLAVVSCVLMMCALQAARAQVSREYPIKAAFLYKFGEFVVWPNPDAEFRVCVVGKDPFGAVLDDLIANERVNGQPVVVVRHATVAGGESCDVAYLGGLGDAQLSRALTVLHASAVLTVTDEASNGNKRGIIHFAVRQNRIRFYIDQGQSNATGLTIRASLLGLAIAQE